MTYRLEFINVPTLAPRSEYCLDCLETLAQED